MIPVSVSKMSLSNKGPVVLLKGVSDPRTLPIFIGTPEAQAIAIRLEGVAVPRPLTHDLMLNLIEPLGAQLKRVEISDLTDNTFFARLILDRDDKEVVIDARPSDAIALAVRCDAPIFVNASVMKAAGIVLQEPAADTSATAQESGQGKRTELEGLEARLAKAIETENYEEAARLRDMIKERGSGSDPN